MYQTEKPDSIAETLRSLDEAIGEFHGIKGNLQWVSAGQWPSSKAENEEQAQAVEQPLLSTPD